MTPQQHANELLAEWQAQRQAKIPVEDRRLPDHDDLAVLRALMERK